MKVAVRVKATHPFACKTASPSDMEQMEGYNTDPYKTEKGKRRILQIGIKCGTFPGFMGHNIVEGNVIIKSKGGSRTLKGVEAMMFQGNNLNFEYTFQGIPNVGITYLSMGGFMVAKRGANDLRECEANSW